MVPLRPLSATAGSCGSGPKGVGNMPHLVVAALLGAGLYAGYRFVARMADEARRAQEELVRKATQSVEKNLGNLEYDKAAGVYRPVDRA